MKSGFVSLVALMVLALPGHGFAQSMLQPSASVTGDTIHIGDLFTNTGTHAMESVAAAPAIGQRVTFSASWLGAVASEHHVAWTPSSDYDRATVERATRFLTADTIGQRLLTEMATNTTADTTIQFDNPGIRFVVPAEASDSIALDGVTLDQRSGRFSAFVSAPADSPNPQRQRVSGRIVYQLTVTVPSRGIAIGDVVGPNDLQTIKLPRERVAGDTVTDASQLVGKAAKRVLRVGELVRAGDVQDPILVHKGETVMIELDTDVMQLTTQGRAMEDGALGASIRITNIQSNRVIDAVIAGSGRAVINRVSNRIASR